MSLLESNEDYTARDRSTPFATEYHQYHQQHMQWSCGDPAPEGGYVLMALRLMFHLKALPKPLNLTKTPIQTLKS